ncbi:MAG: hypothetical protein AAF805_05205 [Planctomycetota bacterium]
MAQSEPRDEPPTEDRPSDAPSAPRRGWVGEGNAAVIAAVIGLVSAVVTAIVPMFTGGGDSATPPAAAPLPIVAGGSFAMNPVHNLTLGVWTLFDSKDDEQTDWGHSTLKFTSQRQSAGAIELDGFFEWRSFGTTVGREFVRAQYDVASQQLFIEGQRVEPPGRLAVGSFSARVSPDGRKLVSGTWGSTPGNLASVPGRWNAYR